MYLGIKLFESIKKSNGLCPFNLHYNDHFTENALTMTIHDLYKSLSKVNSSPNGSLENVLESKHLNLSFRSLPLTSLPNVNARHTLSESNNNNNRSRVFRILKTIQSVF